MNSFEAAFGLGAKNIVEHFVRQGSRVRTAVTMTMAKMNEWAASGWSAIPYKQPIAITSAVAVGLAAVLSEPPPALNLSADFVAPDLTGGSGGQNIPQNVHPMSQPVGQPSAPDLTSMMNRGHVNQSYNVNISGRALRNVNPQSLGENIRNALGGNAKVNIQITDQRRSLTAQSIADILNDD